MVFKNGVVNIEATAYNGARKVYRIKEIQPLNQELLSSVQCSFKNESLNWFMNLGPIFIGFPKYQNIWHSNTLPFK